MSVRPRAVAARMMARSPVHRVLPSGALKTYATLKYHSQRSSPEELAQLVASLGSIPTTDYATAMVAVRAAFQFGLDDQVADALDLLEQRFPESPEVCTLRASLLAFHDDYDSAIALAQRARLLNPSVSSAAALSVTFAYHAWDREAADRNAANMVRRFPVSSAVLWAAAKTCATAEQFDRLYAAWTEAAERRNKPDDLLRAVRQLATAAARANQVDRGIELMAQAMLLLHQGHEPIDHTPARLAGRGSWNAISDICELLDGAGIPYFFAAGTALGFERVGGPLSDDGDIDVGIYEADFDPGQLTKLVSAHPRFVVDPHPLSEKVHMRHRGGCPIDFFRYYKQGDQIWHDGVFVRWWNTPFEVERRPFNGLDIPLPTNQDLYLTENYADWRVPNPEFDSFTDQAPNCTVHWPRYQELHFMRRAFKAMSTGMRAEAAAELRNAGETALADTIGAAA